MQDVGPCKPNKQQQEQLTTKNGMTAISWYLEANGTEAGMIPKIFHDIDLCSVATYNIESQQDEVILFF